MRNVRILACVLLLFVFATTAAQASSNAPLTKEALASILGLPSAACASAGQLERVPPAQKPGVHAKSLCTATAQCFPGTVTCSSNTSTTSCSAADRNCPNERGHVTCDGVTTYCSATCTCNLCCQCDQTGDCVACCRCAGGGPVHCAVQCGGGN